MDDKAEKVALFRYGLIAPLVLETLPRGELTRRAQQIAARLYDIPHSTRRQVSVDTLLDWSLDRKSTRLNSSHANTPHPLPHPLSPSTPLLQPPPPGAQPLPRPPLRHPPFHPPPGLGGHVAGLEP